LFDGARRGACPGATLGDALCDERFAAKPFAAKPVTRSHACCTRPKIDHDSPRDADAPDHPMKAS
jgi:hypothetical protein